MIKTKRLKMLILTIVALQSLHLPLEIYKIQIARNHFHPRPVSRETVWQWPLSKRIMKRIKTYLSTMGTWIGSFHNIFWFFHNILFNQDWLKFLSKKIEKYSAKTSVWISNKCWWAPSFFFQLQIFKKHFFCWLFFMIIVADFTEIFPYTFCPHKCIFSNWLKNAFVYYVKSTFLGMMYSLQVSLK